MNDASEIATLRARIVELEAQVALQAVQAAAREALSPVVLVTGGRAYDNPVAVDRALTALAPKLLIQGGARGADRLCAEWARDNGVDCAEIPALWDTGGRSAGFARNGSMVQLATALGGSLVMFPGGNGTADCVKKARAAGLRVHRGEL